MLSKVAFKSVAVVLVVFCAGCSGLGRLPETMFLMSPEQEAALGEQIAQEIEKEYPLYEAAPGASIYIAELGRSLATRAPATPQKFRFRIVDSDGVNAFAIPGGSIYVLRGLLAEAATEAELAGVVAHEIGHVVARHSAKAVSRAQFYGVLGKLVLGEDTGKLAELAVGIVKSGILLKNSRQSEMEADALAVDILVGANVDPNGLIAFFERLAAHGGGRSSRLLGWMSTHPMTQDRIQAVRRRIHQNVAPGVAWREDSEQFRRLKQRFASGNR